MTLPPALPPALIVHSLEHVRAALRPARPVTLLSAPGAAIYAGCGWWRAMLAAAGTDAPDILDCADAPGRALEALVVGCRRIVLYPCPAWQVVAERVTAAEATLLAERPAALDLADRLQARHIEAWLGMG